MHFSLPKFLIRLIQGLRVKLDRGFLGRVTSHPETANGSPLAIVEGIGKLLSESSKIECICLFEFDMRLNGE